jgi:hypothetical protein
MNASSPFRSLKEYSELEYLLLGDLRDLLEHPLDEDNCRWLTAVLDALFEMLPQEFELEEREGYLEDLSAQHPEYSTEVERLRAEHATLYQRLGQLRNKVAWQAPFAVIAEQVRRDLRDWIHTLVAHNRHEQRLVQNSLNIDTGGGD